MGFGYIVRCDFSGCKAQREIFTNIRFVSPPEGWLYLNHNIMTHDGNYPDFTLCKEHSDLLVGERKEES